MSAARESIIGPNIFSDGENPLYPDFTSGDVLPTYPNEVQEALEAKVIGKSVPFGTNRLETTFGPDALRKTWLEVASLRIDLNDKAVSVIDPQGNVGVHFPHVELSLNGLGSRRGATKIAGDRVVSTLQQLTFLSVALRAANDGKLNTSGFKNQFGVDDANGIRQLISENQRALAANMVKLSLAAAGVFIEKKSGNSTQPSLEPVQVGRTGVVSAIHAPAPEASLIQSPITKRVAAVSSVLSMVGLVLAACSPTGMAPSKETAIPNLQELNATATVEAAVTINPIEQLSNEEFKTKLASEYSELTTNLQTLVPAWKSKILEIEYFSFNREENGNKIQAGWATVISVDGIKYLGRPSADGTQLTVSPLCYTATDEGVSYFTVDEAGVVTPFMEATKTGTIAHLPDGTTVESSVIMENPNAIGGKVASPVDMDLFTSTSFDVNTGILTGKTVDGKDMTWDGTQWNEVRIEDKLPAYAEWMQAHVEGLVAQQEGDVFYLVRELTDGRQIKVFEYADNEWRPSYQSMKEFVREDKTFDLEAAMQTMFMRMGPVDDVDGQPAMSVNMEDYQRFAQEAKKIWEGLSGLKPADFWGGNGGTYVCLEAETAFTLTILTSVGQWQLIGWARNPAGPESVFVIATSDGPVALLNVGEIGYTHLSNKDSIEKVLVKLANQTSTQSGNADVIQLLLDPTINSEFNGTINAGKAELMRAYIRGMKINARKTFTDMRGPASAQRAALNDLFQHSPVPVYDISDKRGY